MKAPASKPEPPKSEAPKLEAVNDEGTRPDAVRPETAKPEKPPATDDAQRAEELRKFAQEQKRKADEERVRIDELRRLAAEEEKRAQESRKRLEAEAAEITSRREEARRRAEAAQKRLEEDGRKAEELRSLADAQKKELDQILSVSEEERRRLEKLKQASQEADSKTREERERMESELAASAQRREEAKKKLEAAQKKLEEDARRAEEIRALAEEQKAKADEMRRKAEEERARVDEMRRAAVAEEKKAREERERLEVESTDLARRREAVRKELEEARETAAQIELEAEAERERIQAESAEVFRRREESKKKLEAAQKKLDHERAAHEEEERKTKELLAEAEIEAHERIEAARRAFEAREEQVREQRELRRQEQDLIRQVEADARRDVAQGRKPLAAASSEPAPRPGKRGALRIADARPPRSANDIPTVPMIAEEGFKSGAPSEPTPASFPEAGTLEQIDFPMLLCRAFDARLTGRLDVLGLDARRTVWFEEGRLVAAASASLVERLEEIALRANLISPAQHHALRTAQEPLARRLAVQMVELGYIRPSEMYRLVRRRVEEIAWSLFLDEESEYEYSQESPPAEERVVLPAHPYALAAEGIRRKFSVDRLYARLGGPATLLKPKGSAELDYFGLSAREKRLASTVDGLRTLEELLFEGGLEEAAALKVLYALMCGGALEIAILGEAAKTKTPEEAARIDAIRVAEKYSQAVAGDYFQVLGLRRDSTTYEVREAYDRLAREFHPDRYAGLDDEALMGKLAEIGRALAEAADVLGDDQVRETYARHLAD